MYGLEIAAYCPLPLQAIYTPKNHLLIFAPLKKWDAMATAEEKVMVEYNEDSIRSLDWREHIRLRPGMYIGKLGDGSSMDDGIYVLVKEVVDNCIDEYTMGFGRQIEINITEGAVTVRSRCCK
jgi:hypothetical protein